MPETVDYPLADCAKECGPLIANGATIWQKFTCSGCGARQTMETPNVFYTAGKCEECGVVTDIEAQGCNYLLLLESR
jgi:hypothetical protein